MARFKKHATKHAAKKNHPTKRRKTRPQATKRHWPFVGIILLIVAAVIAATYLARPTQYIETPKLASKLTAKARLKSHTQKKPEAAAEPRFEFYTMLPKLNIITPHMPVVTPHKHHYILQVASTRSHHDAEQMRARLILYGLDAHIARINTKHGVWYRIALGPYASMSDAEQVLTQLRRKNMSGIIRRVAGPKLKTKI
jgi:cell division protein FtsN